jgi:hypothetical protein
MPTQCERPHKASQSSIFATAVASVAKARQDADLQRHSRSRFVTVIGKLKLRCLEPAGFRPLLDWSDLVDEAIVQRFPCIEVAPAPHVFGDLLGGLAGAPGQGPV